MCKLCVSLSSSIEWVGLELRVLKARTPMNCITVEGFAAEISLLDIYDDSRIKLP